MLGFEPGTADTEEHKSSMLHFPHLAIYDISPSPIFKLGSMAV